MSLTLSHIPKLHYPKQQKRRSCNNKHKFFPFFKKYTFCTLIYNHFNFDKRLFLFISRLFPSVLQLPRHEKLLIHISFFLSTLLLFISSQQEMDSKHIIALKIYKTTKNCQESQALFLCIVTSNTIKVERKVIQLITKEQT